ncbi:MAG: ABC transporter ATP-binding protein [Alicyclobacillaceae bacterium]|nr:ABC transporter ATP-binding protein [Alicyclobacillaceae bacterium]
MSLHVENWVVETESGFCLRVPRLSLETGEIAVLLGAAGAGKSLFFESLAGFHRPAAGSIRVGGEDVSRLPAERRRIGILFQRDALFPHMTVYRNVAYGWRGEKRALSDLMERAGIQDYGHLYPRQLTPYQRQQVSLARILAGGARVVLLDEPTGELEETQKEEWRRRAVRLLREEGVTALVATRDREEALRWSSRIGVLYRGRLLQEGTAEELLSRPQSREVADAMGAGTVFPGRVARCRDSWTAVRIFSDSGFLDLLAWNRWLYREWEDVWVFLPDAALRLWPRRDGEPEGVPNRISAVIAAVHAERYGVRVELDAPLCLSVFIQQRDWENLRLGCGDPVWLTIDPNRLHLVPLQQ